MPPSQYGFRWEQARWMTGGHWLGCFIVSQPEALLKPLLPATMSRPDAPRRNHAPTDQSKSRPAAAPASRLVTAPSRKGPSPRPTHGLPQVSVGSVADLLFECDLRASDHGNVPICGRAWASPPIEHFGSSLSAPIVYVPSLGQRGKEVAGGWPAGLWPPR